MKKIISLILSMSMALSLGAGLLSGCQETKREFKNVILVIGDGRSEISAGVKMGALCVSRLEKTDTYRRELHKKLGSNIVLESYLEKDFLALMHLSE